VGLATTMAASSAVAVPAPVSAESTGAVVINTAGAVLPDPGRTPGATNPAVTQANIRSTICVSGWTATIRPDSDYTTSLKEQQLASGYAFHGDVSTADYEEDHLISLEIGGSPTSPLNLWPEPYNTPDGARTKDVVENKLNALVCGGTITLIAAQQAIAVNWWTAYTTYVGSGTAPVVPPVTSAPAPPAPATTPAAAPAGPPSGATALCNDGSYSYGAHHQGACSSHGGVRIFYK
jgi:Protein of unknown function (DUF3761)